MFLQRGQGTVEVRQQGTISVNRSRVPFFIPKLFFQFLSTEIILCLCSHLFLGVICSLFFSLASLSVKNGGRSLIAVRFYRSLSGRQAEGQIHIVTVTDKNAVSESSCVGVGVVQ